MSFSSLAKEELLRLPLGKNCCVMSELSALVQTSGSLQLRGGGRVRVTFRVESAGLARRIGGIIALSGPLDVISDGEQTMVLRNGCPTMARITGSGCMLTSLIGAFCGAMPSDPFAAVCTAMAAMGVCGEAAEARRLKNGTGNATFRTDLIDAVFNLTEKQLTEGVRYEIY